MMNTVALVMIVVGLWAAVGVAQEEGVIPWSYYVKDGSSADMYCNDSNSERQPESDYLLKWFRNGEEVMESAEKYEFVEGMGLHKLNLIVKNVLEADYGAYYCVVYNSSMDLAFTLRKVINVQGKVFESLGDKYRVPIITGAVAAAIFLLCLLVVAFVYKFRFKADSKKYTLNNGDFYGVDNSKVNANAFDNPALQDDEHKGTNIEMMVTAANGKEEITTEID